MEFPLFVPVSGPSESMIHIHKHSHVYPLKGKVAMNEINEPEVKPALVKKIPRDPPHLHLLFLIAHKCASTSLKVSTVYQMYAS